MFLEFSTDLVYPPAMNFRQRFQVPLAVAIVFALIYSWKFGPATSLILRAKNAAKKNPLLATVPIELPDRSVSTAPGTTFTEFGFQFEVPWIAKEKPHGDHIAIIYVPDGTAALLFFNPAEDKGLVKELRQTFKDQGKDPVYANLYLDAKSDYDLERSTWYATPEQLSVFFPRKKEVFNATRLMTKDVLGAEAKTGLYAFTFGQLRGFQFGDPARVHSIRVDAFDDQDRKFVFSIGTKSDSNVYLKQADINRVLQSLRPAHSSTTAN